MGQNFRPVERDQTYLMPPSLRDWLPADELAWFVLDAVASLDLGPLYARYRADGHGAAAFEPAMMTALLLYAYATGERSSRRIETNCRRDIAYRVIAANQVPDHATIARFRALHEATIAHLFNEILRLCAAAGMARLGLVAIDGTKIAADANLRGNRTAAALEAEIAAILAEAAATDAAEDAAFGPERRGDELPPELADPRSRLARLREAKRQLDAAEDERQAVHATRLAERSARAAAKGGKPKGPTPKPPRPRPEAKANPTDPDSRTMKAFGGAVQGYNGQAAVADDGIVLAAELTQDAVDYAWLGPMIEATNVGAARAGIAGPIGVVVADAGYWSAAAVSAQAGGPELLVPSARHELKHGRAAQPALLAVRLAMEHRLASDRGRALYGRRKVIVEPVFGQIKAARGIRRFRRRGLVACASEWKLVCATHNLLKLWRSGRRSPLPPPAAAGV